LKHCKKNVKDSKDYPDAFLFSFTGETLQDLNWTSDNRQ